jgi:hypothetical protein
MLKALIFMTLRHDVRDFTGTSVNAGGEGARVVAARELAGQNLR